jgi:hypothetical protein
LSGVCGCFRFVWAMTSPSWPKRWRWSHEKRRCSAPRGGVPAAAMRDVVASTAEHRVRTRDACALEPYALVVGMAAGQRR